MRLSSLITQIHTVTPDCVHQNTSMATSTIDPSSMPLWTNVDAASIEACVQKMYSVGDKIRAVFNGGSIDIGDSPQHDFRQSIQSILEFYSRNSTTHFHMQDDMQMSAITMVVRGLRTDSDGQILVEIKYFVGKKDDPNLASLVNDAQRVIRGSPTRPLQMVCPLEEQRIWINLLKENTTALTADYVQSVMKNEPIKRFNVSFFKLPGAQEIHAPKVEACCAFCNGNSALKKCGRCKAIQYCSEFCQKQHWKVHKEVCKSAAQLPQDDISVVFPLNTTDPSLKGMFVTDVNRKGFISDTQKASDVKVKNPYGDSEFLVKYQTPLMGGGPGLLYDQKRSFQTFVAESCPGADKLNQKVRASGIPRLYARARLEGHNVRVFLTDLPKQVQNF